MKFEMPPMPSPENEKEKAPKKIELTSEEFNFMGEANPKDQKLLDLMEKKGISFNNGFIEVEVDGKKYEMVTDVDDFGTAQEKE